MRKIWWNIVAIVVLAAILYLIWVQFSESYDVEKGLKQEIEQAIKVKSAENKIIKMERVYGLFSAGVGVGVGVGAPQVVAYSAEQFLSLIPKGEAIYVALDASTLSVSGGRAYLLKKVYMSFIENRGGIIIYEDSYSHEQNGRQLWLQSYDWNSVSLHYDNHHNVKAFMIFVVIGGLFVVNMVLFDGFI